MRKRQSYSAKLGFRGGKNLIEKLHRKYLGFFYKRIKSCKKCGSKGYLAGHGKGYKCACSHCTRSGKVRRTRLGALIDWNQEN